MNRGTLVSRGSQPSLGRKLVRGAATLWMLGLAGAGAAPVSPPALPISQPLRLERGPLDRTLLGCLNAALGALPFRTFFTDEAWRAQTGSRWDDQTFRVPAATTWTGVVEHYAAALPGWQAAKVRAPAVDPALHLKIKCRLALWTSGLGPFKRQVAVAMIDQPLQQRGAPPFKVVFLIRPAP
ncbi:hypothetical protein ACFFLM_08280 [Deinococcus oregonensis]|uniref:Secreted protein n=1 Tax=Deinococcus oregonensis TaxID=1805970 RepID=A0ABV6AZ04_9DEIO